MTLKLSANDIKLKGGDFLAGGGGMTHAMTEIEGLECAWVLDHSKVAIRTNMFHHKGVKHYLADFYKQDEHEMEHVDFVHCSVECTQHSKANGGKDKKIESYTLAHELYRYMVHLMPYVLAIENVPEFKKWGPVKIKEDKKKSTPDYSVLATNKKGEYKLEPIKERKGEEFELWKAKICSLGYDYHEDIRNAADDGLPTRRVRYFAFFTKKELGMQVRWPEYTHHKTGKFGRKVWEPCRPYINLEKEGYSIFGREFNEALPKQHRKPHCHNTKKRLAGGIKKLHPEMYMIMQYYGSGLNVQDINAPLNTITCKDRNLLVKIKKMQFIQDYCHGDIFNDIDSPMGTQLTWQTKQLVTVDKLEFISDSTFADDSKNFNVDEPCSTLTSQQRHQLVKANFLSAQYNSNGRPESNNLSLDNPFWSITTKEKFQFISAYFNSSGKPETQNQSLDSPLNCITTGANKQALITAMKNGLLDFDIKVRFLEPEELGQISTFPEGYFTNPKLKLSKKNAVKLIGNAVPPMWGKKIIEPVIQELREKLLYTKKI